MKVLDVSILCAAGFGAGAGNAIVGSGSLLTFPALVGLGYSPLVSNVSSNVGLVFGTVSGSLGYHRELAGQRARVVSLAGFALAGGVVGALLLLVLPPTVFRAVAPALVAFAVLLVAVQPRLAAALVSRGTSEVRLTSLRLAVLLTSIYGGYFGAAQGVIMIAWLTVLVPDSLHRLNAVKNVLMALATILPAVIFASRAPVAWQAAAVIAISSVLGAQFGALVGRRLTARVVRRIIIGCGVIAFVVLVM